MAAPLSKAAPPPPTAEQRAQRLKQKRLVLSSVLGLLVLLIVWQAYDYFVSAPQRALERISEGKRSMTPAHYAEAVPFFDQAIEIDPASWDAYLQRGLANRNLEKSDAALRDFDHALALNPDVLEARVARAEIYRQRGDTQKAIEELTEVIRLKPTVSAYYDRGLAYAELGRHELAIPDFTWAIEQIRDAPFAYLARAKSKRALGDEKGARLDEQGYDSLDRGNVH